MKSSPEISVVNGEASECTGSTAKPKALPLMVSQAARQGLARIVTHSTLPHQAQTQLGGYVHGLTVAASVSQPMILGQQVTPAGGRTIQDVNITQRIPPEFKPPVNNQHEVVEHGSGERALRRSKSAGQAPPTPSRRTGISGNSKSCPPARLKASPTKEVLKHSGKTRKDLTSCGESAKGDSGGLKNKHSGPPLRRAGMDTSRKIDFFKKSKEVPLHCQGAALAAEKASLLLMSCVNRLLLLSKLEMREPNGFPTIQMNRGSLLND